MTTSEVMNLKALLLAGGQSSRMLQPKHLLRLPPNNTPLFLHLLTQLHAICPDPGSLYISLQHKSSTDDLITDNQQTQAPFPFTPIYDASTNLGPAAGLLSAHHADPTAHWLVVPCDFPLLTSEALELLRSQYEDQVTCFENTEGFYEPLLGVWSPTALQRLETNVRNGKTGPKFTVKELGGKTIRSPNLRWVTSVNTPEEWAEAIKMMAN